nr:MAG TPA: hypothetical protein [Bacteriophage sp.]
MNKNNNPPIVGYTGRIFLNTIMLNRIFVIH